MSKEIMNMLKTIREYDGCLDVKELNIRINNEKITDLEYVGDNRNLMELMDYQSMPVAYYDESGSINAFSWLKPEKQNEIALKVINYFK